MDSKMPEEVKKRRGKPSPINLYQRVVLLAGAAALVFSVWTTPASVPAVGVIGTTLLIFFVLKDSKEKQDKGNRFDLKEMLPEAGQNVVLQEMLPEAEKNADLQGMLPEAGENMDPQEMLPEAEKNADLREMLPEAGENVDLQKILSESEEKDRAEKMV